MARSKSRTYDASDFKELMDNAGGWAQNWDDVLWYLEHVAAYDADFAKNEVPGMSEDVRRLKKEDRQFTTDYREAWQALTGEPADRLPPPEGVKKPPVHPIELAETHLKGLKFPAKKGDALDSAKGNDAPKSVLDVLNEIDDEEYRDLGQLLEEVGDVTWDHD